MGKENPFFTVTSDIGAELYEARKEAEAATPIEFGKQEATAKEWREEVKTNETFRKEELERMGAKEFLKTWGKNRGSR